MEKKIALSEVNDCLGCGLGKGITVNSVYLLGESYNFVC